MREKEEKWKVKVTATLKEGNRTTTDHEKVEASRRRRIEVWKEVSKSN